MISPRPLRQFKPNVRKPQRLWEKPPVTVCIAAACDEGTKVVCATDGLLSYGPVTADNLLSKFIWLDDWLCMFAGNPANVEMTMEALHDVTNGAKLTRANIKKMFLAAYRKRQGEWPVQGVGPV